VPFRGQLYELDGLQKGPICYGECTEDNWLSLAREQIQQRIMRYEATEIRFNLLALIGDKREQAEAEIQRLRLVRNAIENVLGAPPTDNLGEADFSSVQDELERLMTQSPEEQVLALGDIAERIGACEARIAQEQDRQARWKTENERRRHNYVPLLFELLQQLAKNNMLKPMFDEAVEAKKKKHEEKKANKAKKA